MEIVELMLRGYGRFSGHRITFRPGVNIIYGGNESGKTTIHSFIRAMFFGLSRQKGRAARKDEYQIRQPWDTPGTFLGSMRIRENGVVYRIDRCFDRSAEPLKLVCETQAREYAHPQQELDRLMGGISESVFVNTVFIPQAHCETDEALALELQKYMVNCGSSMDGEIDVTASLQMLRRKKKILEQQKKKEEEKLEEQIEDCQRKADVLRGELELLRRQTGQYQKTAPSEAPVRYVSDASGEPDDGSSGEDAVSPVLLTAVFVLLILAAVLSAAGAVFFQKTAAKIFLGVCAVLFLGMAAALRLIFRGGNGAEEETDSDGEIKPQAFVPPELAHEIQEREAAYGKLQDKLERLYQQHVRPEGTETEIAAVALAIDRICELSDRIFQTRGGRLGETASGILSGLTQGRYNRIVMDDAGEVRIHTPSRVLGLHQVSMGTMQQIYFSLRMAAGELLCQETKLPLILDEPFALYDDERLEAALSWLKDSGRQVILFTCQTREREILKRLEHRQ